MNGGFKPGEFGIVAGGGKSAFGQPAEPSDESYYMVNWEHWQARVKVTSYETLVAVRNNFIYLMNLVLDQYNKGMRSKDDSNQMLAVYTQQKKYIEQVIEQQEARAVAELTARF
jgi:hypothetical protein